MKANCVESLKLNVNTNPQSLNFRGERVMLTKDDGHDTFVSEKKKGKNNRTLLALGGLALIGTGAVIAHKAGWFKKAVDKTTKSEIITFKSVDEAKKYFEDLGINTEFRDVNNEHLSLLNRIKDDLKKLKELGVKFDKPDTLTISDWHKAEEYKELCRKRGISAERKEEYYAFCEGDKNGANHIFVNSSKPNSDSFRHEMGHANHHRGHDSFWEAKGVKDHDFADKQLEILGKNIKVYRDGPVNDIEQNNIFHLSLKNNGKGLFCTSDGEARFVYISELLAKMNSETGCYKPDSLSEQVAYIFDSLVKGDKTFSDEVMLYYDFAGGARIPNLKIAGKTYDEYMESLYNNVDLINKLRENVKISKI